MKAARETSLPELLQRWRIQSPNRVALTAGDRTWTFEALADAVDAGARGLRSEGVSAGDRVAIVGHNTWQWVVAYLATLRLGAIIVPLNSRLSPSQVKELMSLIEPRVALADEPHAPMFADCPEVYRLQLDSGLPGDWLWPSRVAPDLPPMPAIDTPAIISFTSGTTGVPKGAVLTQGALSAASRIICESMELSQESSTLIVAPLFHNTGFIDQLGALLHVGGRTDLLPVYHTKDAVAAFARRSVTYITAVPSVLRLLMMAENAEAVFRPARTVLFGGSPMPATWSTELLTRWPHLELRHGYGLTEFGSAVAILPSRLIAAHGESVGYPPAGVNVRLVGEDGEDVSGGEVGEIWVSGPTRMTEYWKRPEATALKLCGEWLRTGDLARLAEKGLLFIVGRRDDTINRGGEKILPQFVESALAERPDVAQCVVFGVPHPIFQQTVIAGVEPRPGHQFDASAARAHLSVRIPDYAIPEDFLIEQALPRTGSGKIDRRATRTLYLASRAERMK